MKRTTKKMSGGWLGLLMLSWMLCGHIALVQAADWQLVLSDRSRRVEIDRSSIFASDPGTKVAWGRVVLSEQEAAAQGYAMIKALNRYDCQNRTFQTVKRVYVDVDEHLIREEGLDDSVPAQRPAPNSVDERMWREICRPAGGGGTVAVPGGELHRVASEIQRLVAALDSGDRSQFAPEPEPRLTPVAPLPQPASAPAAAAPRSAARPVSPAATSASTLSPVAAPRRSPSAAGFDDPEFDDPIATLIDAAAAERIEQTGGPARSYPIQPAGGATTGGWSYREESADGPAHWGQLRPEWALCAQGKRQAPVDLSESLPVALAPLEMHYVRSGIRIHSRDDALEVEISEGMGVTVRGVRYLLHSFTFHRPAAELALTLGYDLAIYFHHRSLAGEAAIVEVRLRAGALENPLLETVLANLPLERGGVHVPEATVDLAAFMPTGDAHFLYMGSLPMPPCTEDVLWVVLKPLQTLSQTQLELLARLYPPNMRPVQPAHGRMILESR